MFDIGELRASRVASPELKKLAVDRGEPIAALFPRR
jgi:hypothetical protein